jgi:hypothetical protein
VFNEVHVAVVTRGIHHEPLRGHAHVLGGRQAASLGHSLPQLPPVQVVRLLLLLSAVLAVLSGPKILAPMCLASNYDYFYFF